MTPFDYQTKIAEQALDKLRLYGMVYLAMEERTGKTLTSLLVAENSKANNILVLTKKKALDGWFDTLTKWDHSKNFIVTNYHQANKLKDKFDLVILDEAHSYLAAYPKLGKIWKDVAAITLKQELPIIYLSATPYAQGPQQLYHQFKLCIYSPWRKYKTFYQWFKDYGIPSKVRTPYGLKETYSVVDERKVLADVSSLFIKYSRKDLGFEFEPTDKLHYVDLDEWTRQLYNKLLKDQYTTYDDYEIVCDNPIKLRTTLHQIEGGALKIDDKYIELPNKEKINYILNTWGDTENLCIMYNYVGEGLKLQRYFKKAKLLQATSYAEGVDLHHVDNLVIYSQDFSTARFTQRRARQCNINRKKPIVVHFLLVKKAISEQVYKVVSLNKQNFVDSLFQREEI